MSRQLFLAPFSAHDATDCLLKEVLAVVPGPDFREVTYLTPSPRKLRDVEVRFARTADRDAFLPPRFRTLPELARDLHEQFGTTRRFRAELKPLLVQHLLAREPPGIAPPPPIGYCRAVANFIRDLKLCAATDDLTGTRRTITDLLNPYEKPRKSARKALDVLARYSAALAAKAWSDDEDILALASSRVAAAGPIRLLVLDSFVAPDPLELRLIAALLERAEHVLALCYGDDGNGQAYEFGRDFRQFLAARAFSISELKPSSAGAEPRLLRFNSPEDELTGIARDIKQRCLEGALDLTDTIVALPALGSAAPLVGRVFREYGIPATVYPSQDLSASPPVVAALELLRAIESGYERVATTAAFSSAYLPGLLRLSSDRNGPERAAAAATLNHAARKAGIIKDADAWRHLAEKLAPDYGFEREEDRQSALDLEKRVRQAIGLAEKTMSGARTLGEYAGRFTQLLGAADFCRNLDTDDQETSVLVKDRGELYDILSGLVGFEQDFGAQPAGLDEFARTLTYLVGLASRTAERAPRGVLVLSLSETLGLAPQHLYLGSLTESNLPSRYPVDPLLPDTVRRTLRLPDMVWHQNHERFHLERTRSCSRTPPWLSYHAAAEGRPLLPTPYLDIEPVPAQPAAGIFSPEEEQRVLGAASAQTPPETVAPAAFAQDGEVLAALDRSFGPLKRLSVTRLERYRACPYCFYVSDVLGLEPLMPPALEIEPQQWGIIMHRVLAGLYKKGTVPFEELKRRALASLEEVIGEFGLNPFWTEVCRRLFANNIDDIVRYEAELRAEGFAPAGTEVSLVGEVGPGVTVKGRLDRYDSDGKKLRVLDYKTGADPKISPKEVTEERTHLQLPVYCHLLKNTHPGKSIDNMGIYSTRNARVHWLADDKCRVEDLLRAALENALDIARSIRAGEFPARPADEKMCNECPQAHLCGRGRPARTEER